MWMFLFGYYWKNNNQFVILVGFSYMESIWNLHVDFWKKKKKKKK